ncbi:hypothetical protein L6452_43569 [Arctium lappa]|uniref:Uncharacterized protein n=1 Tax=Arctium lappa TaxID=4217 RepID=A0ACB8XDL4_ARCLA|nr:hypothetical protein L6452_43569 [Arctium lappa]
MYKNEVRIKKCYMVIESIKYSTKTLEWLRSEIQKRLGISKVPTEPTTNDELSVLCDNDLIIINPWDLPKLLGFCNANFDRKNIRNIDGKATKDNMGDRVRKRSLVDLQVSLDMGLDKFNVQAPNEDLEDINNYNSREILKTLELESTYRNDNRLRDL